jgi:vacuolar-type H+-ATPase subunit H
LAEAEAEKERILNEAEAERETLLEEALANIDELYALMD